ncbi:TetR/AcrR family transcriptional regulator [Schumannella sp. 10F1B-5-1]|uniref:TetR/AcrR family transcriptional regulator n=1 Tax=Schumannella sp. 10F1B-5-1 TaxID=2590780 RepID=UPI0011322AE8|nr:TetR/AcrR family transcriptional regulator [Schumannella sp. 10F1B-5-1]TPW73163.1 helix-turn-helix transcriptional regulator [Schumannella sp. 10F1B-5-1]
MPRITDERRAQRRAAIVAAARRCFSRNGFHQTSMPDIAAEAGVSTGAPYRYFTGKDELILEIAGDAFHLIFAPLERAVDRGEPLTVADLIRASVTSASDDVAVDASGAPVPVGELLNCAVQAWAELLRDEHLRARATAGFETMRAEMAAALRRGQESGRVDRHLDLDHTTRVVMALLHGFVLQRTAFGLSDPEGFLDDLDVVVAPLGLAGR